MRAATDCGEAAVVMVKRTALTGLLMVASVAVVLAVIVAWSNHTCVPLGHVVAATSS